MRTSGTSGLLSARLSAFKSILFVLLDTEWLSFLCDEAHLHDGLRGVVQKIA